MRTITFLIAVMMIVCTVTYATIINVPGDYIIIQAGLNAATQGDTVLVQPGTYQENIFWTAVSSIKLFSAGDSSNTIIDGDGNSTVLYFPGLGIIDTTSVIRGFRITNGGNVEYGGGIYMTHSSPIIERCLVDNNIVGGGIYCNNFSRAIIRYSRISQNNEGGIIFADNSTGEVAHCDIVGNSNEGGISCLNSSPTLTDVTISGNTAGGIYCYYSSATFTGVTVSGNWAGYRGGIYCVGSSPTFTNVTVSGNLALFGGGIYCSGSSATFTNVTVSGNTAGTGAGGGGGIYCNGSSPTFTHVSVIGNTCRYGGGGGIYCNGSSPTFSDVTVSGNRADSSSGDGGGIYCVGSNPTFSEVLVENNSASTCGGGIYCESGSNPSIEHCTIAHNRAAIEGDGFYTTDNSWPTISHCNIYSNGMGVYNDDNSQMLNCSNNWWGDASGPYHPSYNPGGLGDSVNAFVYPLPFLTEPDTLAPPAVVSDHSPSSPAAFALFPNYPNPFNPTTTIAFELPIMAKVTLKVYNILGREVGVVMNGEVMEAGQHTVKFDGRDFASGVYFYQLNVGNYSEVHKMVLLK